MTASKWSTVLNGLNWYSSGRYETQPLVGQNFEKRVMNYDVTTVMSVFLNNEKSTMLTSQINPEGVEVFCNIKTSFCFIKQIWPLVTCVHTPYTGWDFRMWPSAVLTKRRMKLNLTTVNSSAIYRRIKTKPY